MKVAEIFADLGFKVQGAEDLKAFETTLQNIAAAARNAALALKVLARTSVPKELTQVKQKAAAAPTVQEIEKATGIKASDVVDASGNPTTPVSIPTEPVVQSSAAVFSLVMVLKALTQAAREASKELTKGMSTGKMGAGSVVLFDANGNPIKPAVAPAPIPNTSASPAPAPQSGAQPRVPNIPPGVYGQNVLHGPPPPTHVPPLLTPKNPNNGMPTAVLQGFKMLGALGLKVFGITTIALALKKLVQALTEMVAASMKATFAVDKLTFQTGLSRREFKEWEHIAALSDVTSDELQDQLKRLQTLSRQIRYTGEGATPFMQLGINSQASPTEIMKQFAARTQHMDAATAVYWGSLIGLSENMVYMLRKQGDKLKSLTPGSELSDKEYQQVTELNAAWKELTYTLSLLKDKLTSDLAPALVKIFNVISDFLKILTVSKDARGAAVRTLTSPSGVTGPLEISWMALKMLYGMRGGGKTTNVENNVSVKVDGSAKPNETAKATAKTVERAIASPALYGSQAAQAGANW